MEYFIKIVETRDSRVEFCKFPVDNLRWTISGGQFLVDHMVEQPPRKYLKIEEAWNMMEESENL